jgi:hypothetical protein
VASAVSTIILVIIAAVLAGFATSYVIGIVGRAWVGGSMDILYIEIRSVSDDEHIVTIFFRNGLASPAYMKLEIRNVFPRASMFCPDAKQIPLPGSSQPQPTSPQPPRYTPTLPAPPLPEPGSDRIFPQESGYSEASGSSDYEIAIEISPSSSGSVSCIVKGTLIPLPSGIISYRVAGESTYREASARIIYR